MVRTQLDFQKLLGLWYVESRYARRMQNIVSTRIADGLGMIPTVYRKSAAISEWDDQGNWDDVGADLKRALKAGGGEVALLSLNGTMSRFGICGMGGNEYMASLLDRASREPEVKAVVLSAHTPGGTVDSTEMLADTIKNFKKPIVGYVNGMCASAGVFALSQADSIVMEDSVSAEIGSIGVLMVYANEGKALKKEGIEVEIFRADGSEDKARLNAYEPLTEQVRAEIQADLNEARRTFVGYVRRGRAGKITLDEVFSGRMYKRKDALSLGLVDRLGTLQDAIRMARKL